MYLFLKTCSNKNTIENNYEFAGIDSAYAASVIAPETIFQALDTVSLQVRSACVRVEF